MTKMTAAEDTNQKQAAVYQYHEPNTAELKKTNFFQHVDGVGGSELD